MCVRAVDCKRRLLCNECIRANYCSSDAANLFPIIPNLIYCFVICWFSYSPCHTSLAPLHKHGILGLGEIDLYLNRLPCFVHTYHSEPSDWIDQRAQLLTLHLVTPHTLPPLEATRLLAWIKKLQRIQLPGPSEQYPSQCNVEVISPGEGEWSH